MPTRLRPNAVKPTQRSWAVGAAAAAFLLVFALSHDEGAGETPADSTETAVPVKLKLDHLHPFWLAVSPPRAR